MKRKRNWLYWTPRVLGIIIPCFLAIFALDVFGQYGFLETLVALFMHLIPNFILLLILWIAWKHETVGGILYLVAGLLLLLIMGKQQILNYIIVAGPVFATGILFLMNKKR